MAKPRTVRVMLSSRSTSAVTLDDAQQVTLEELRRELKSKLEEVTLFGERLFEVWIHEDAAADDASLDAWDESLAQIKKADVVLVLYNGEAGWTTPNGTQGICHDEMAAAVDTAPGLVRLIQLPLAPLPRRAAERRRDERFRVYVERQARWRQEANSRDELWAETQVSLRAALDYVVQVGSRAAATGANAYGTSLDWDLLDLAGFGIKFPDVGLPIARVPDGPVGVHDEIVGSRPLGQVESLELAGVRIEDGRVVGPLSHEPDAPVWRHVRIPWATLLVRHQPFGDHDRVGVDGEGSGRRDGGRDGED